MAVGWLLSGPFFTIVFPSLLPPRHQLRGPTRPRPGDPGGYRYIQLYLSAHALGRALRNAGLVLTVSNVVFNFALIPPFGAAGAAWASVLALVANLAAHVVGYRRVAHGIARCADPSATFV